MSDRAMQVLKKRFEARFSPPGSKSLTNRALVLAALGRGRSRLSNVLMADDTRVMLDNLKALGFAVDIDAAANEVIIEGTGGEIPAGKAELFCGNSGTTIRFLTAMCALGKGSYRLDGVERMRNRPIGELVELLKKLGAKIGYTDKEGFPPIEVQADGIKGGEGNFGAAMSSQYLSAVLQVAPYANQEVEIALEAGQTSWPYVTMTMRLMDEFWVTPELVRDPATGQPMRVIVPQGVYRATDYRIEPDASNATYFMAAAAAHAGSRITIEGLGTHSLQGDVRFANVLKRMGAQVVMERAQVTVEGTETLEGIEVDLADMPDTAQTLAALALLAKGETVIHGLKTLRVKETDRLAALATELAKFGAKVEVREGETLVIQPPTKLSGAAVATYDDHRMAMSFAVAGTKIQGVTILDRECVNKTYPQFFDDLARLYQ